MRAVIALVGASLVLLSSVRPSDADEQQRTEAQARQTVARQRAERPAG